MKETTHITELATAWASWGTGIDFMSLEVGRKVVARRAYQTGDFTTYLIRDVMTVRDGGRWSNQCQYATRSPATGANNWTDCREGSYFSEIEPYATGEDIDLQALVNRDD